MKVRHPTPLAALSAACAFVLALPACAGKGESTGAVASASSDAGASLHRKAPLDADATDHAPISPVSPAPLDASSARVLGVPRATAPLVPTGRFRVELWGHAANTHTLLGADGRGAVPVNEARFLWGDGRLYLFFYAGDLDLQAHVKKHDGPVWNDDSVAMTFGGPGNAKRIIQISVTGVTADGLCPTEATTLADPRCDLRWESGVRAGTDSDGTLNTIGDRDEEWAVEAAVPLASLGLGSTGAGARIPFSVRRCEIAHDGPRACGAWGEGPGGPGVLVLEDLGPPGR